MLVSEPRDKMQERQETGGKNGVWSMLKLPAEVRPKVQKSHRQVPALHGCQLTGRCCQLLPGKLFVYSTVAH